MTQKRLNLKNTASKTSRTGVQSFVRRSTTLAFLCSSQVSSFSFATNIDHTLPWGGPSTTSLSGATTGIGISLDGRNKRQIRRVPSFLGSAIDSTTTTTTTSSPTSMMESPSAPTPGSAEVLESLRAEMASEGVDCLLVPSDDPHLSEYVSEAYGRRAYVSGFDGSAGTAVVTADAAYLWTDSRYWSQAVLQLNAEHWTLMKSGQTEPTKVPTIPKFLAKMAKERKKEGLPFRVGIDPYVHSASFAAEVEEVFQSVIASSGDTEGVGVGLCSLDSNLVDRVWAEARPAVPQSPFRVHPLEFAGRSATEKIAAVRTEMTKGEDDDSSTLAVFCALDEVAYLFNLRAMGDVVTCPVGIAYAAVDANGGAFLYCDEAKVASEEVRRHLEESGVEVRPYEQIVPDVIEHACGLNTNGEGGVKDCPKIWVDKNRCNYAVFGAVPKHCRVDRSPNAVVPMKARKNEAELEGMRKAHVMDGAAMARALSRLESTLMTDTDAGMVTVSEVEVDDRFITAERSRLPGFLEVSFPSICGVGPNGAIVHYGADAKSDLLRYLDRNTPILIDSGGQYEYGTTDVTRTLHFGAASADASIVADDDFREMYTRVLKGNIALDRTVWPAGTPGFVLDAFARQHLWQAHRDYGHGTGHGVGAALNVHEGPISVSPRFGNLESLDEGMVLSNEPGHYVDGHYGIRIENLLEVVKDENGAPSPSGSARKFLGFRKLTLIPIQFDGLLRMDLMTDDELNWLDAYHANVLEQVGPLLQAEEDADALRWLQRSCRKVERVK